MRSARPAPGPTEPWLPAQWVAADAAAIQALARGDATPEQQRRALKYIVETLADTYGLSFRPGNEEGRRSTDFAEGKRLVGLGIVKLLHINVAKFASQDGVGEHG